MEKLCLGEAPGGDTSVDAKHATKNDVSRHRVCYDLQKLKISRFPIN